jgi:hypothetical protein
MFRYSLVPKTKNQRSKVIKILFFTFREKNLWFNEQINSLKKRFLIWLEEFNNQFKKVDWKKEFFEDLSIGENINKISESNTIERIKITVIIETIIVKHNKYSLGILNKYILRLETTFRIRDWSSKDIINVKWVWLFCYISTRKQKLNNRRRSSFYTLVRVCIWSLRIQKAREEKKISMYIMRWWCFSEINKWFLILWDTNIEKKFFSEEYDRMPLTTNKNSFADIW